ncbi:MAG: DUF3368 domain-containing protein [Methanobacteriota archaeon]
MKSPHWAWVICNTSPFLYLHQIGLLSIMPSLFGEIVTTPAVVQELEAGRENGVDVPDISSLSWVTIQIPQASKAIPLVTDLGDGETEVLMLALEKPDSLVIIDDNLARTYAEVNHISVAGTCALLLKAKQCGLIEEVSKHVKCLEQKGFYLSKEVKSMIINLAHE